MKKFYLILVIVIVGLLIWLSVSKKNIDEPKQNLEEQVSEITYVNASQDLIVPELPFPGAVTGKDFSVIGKARGNWYFEASFPIDVLDKDGNILVKSYATAQGEWMTTEFVPFKGEVKIPETYIGPATLVLHKDNASGEPDKDASISFPIVIEY